MITFDEPFDPADSTDYELDVSAFLEEGEALAGFILTPTNASVAAGLSVRDDGSYAAIESGPGLIRFWPMIAEEARSDTCWRGAGQALAIELTFWSAATPPRNWQRSVALRVRQL